MMSLQKTVNTLQVFPLLTMFRQLSLLNLNPDYLTFYKKLFFSITHRTPITNPFAMTIQFFFLTCNALL